MMLDRGRRDKGGGEDMDSSLSSKLVLLAAALGRRLRAWLNALRRARVSESSTLTRAAISSADSPVCQALASASVWNSTSRDFLGVPEVLTRDRQCWEGTPVQCRPAFAAKNTEVCCPRYTPSKSLKAMVQSSTRFFSLTYTTASWLGVRYRWRRKGLPLFVYFFTQAPPVMVENRA